MFRLKSHKNLKFVHFLIMKISLENIFYCTGLRGELGVNKSRIYVILFYIPTLSRPAGGDNNESWKRINQQVLKLFPVCFMKKSKNLWYSDPPPTTVLLQYFVYTLQNNEPIPNLTKLISYEFFFTNIPAFYDVAYWLPLCVKT